MLDSFKSYGKFRDTPLGVIVTGLTDPMKDVLRGLREIGKIGLTYIGIENKEKESELLK